MGPKRPLPYRHRPFRIARSRFTRNAFLASSERPLKPLRCRGPRVSRHPPPGDPNPRCGVPRPGVDRHRVRGRVPRREPATARHHHRTGPTGLRRRLRPLHRHPGATPHIRHPRPRRGWRETPTPLQRRGSRGCSGEIGNAFRANRERGPLATPENFPLPFPLFRAVLSLLTAVTRLPSRGGIPIFRAVATT